MSNQLIEIFLFIDPLGKKCNNIRKIINNFRNERPEKISIRVIPMVNFNKVYRHTRRQSTHTSSSAVDRTNHFSTNTYHACLAYHASAMQGKKRAQKFLTILQEQVVEEGLPYSEELMYSIVKNIGLDMEMFTEDYHSELTKKFYKKNLQLAADMRVKGTPSCIIFKSDNEQQAFRLTKKIDIETLHAICGIENSLKPVEITDHDDCEDEEDRENEQKFSNNIMKFKMS